MTETDTEEGVVTVDGDVLRATSWDEFVGQDQMKARLRVHISAAIAQERFLDHVLFAGPPGFGKTTLARILGVETGQIVQQVTMPLKPKALIALITETSWGDIIFFDEVHRCPKSQQEDLLPLIEEGYLQLPGGGRLEWGGTFVGATTEPERLIEPLYDRFPIKPAFVDYDPVEMAEIVQGMAAKAGLEFDDELSLALGQATAGTPRNARTFVLGARDLAAIGVPVTVETILELTDTDPDGLSRQHLNYLRELSLNGGLAGQAAMATLLRLSVPMVSELERVLLKYHFISLATGGRQLTNVGWKKARS